VLANLSGADPGLPERSEANAYLAAPSQPAWQPAPRTLWGGLALAAVAVIAIALYLRRQPAAPAPRPGGAATVNAQSRKRRRK
jgi:hypothetical protein